jgi:uncharacterized membrane protein
MSTTPFDTTRPPPVPSSGEFTTAWIAYASFGFGMLMWWPKLIGLVIAYVRRGDPSTGFIDSHYRWLIRTFWWSTLWYVAALGVIASGVLPIVTDVLRSVAAHHGGEVEIRTLINLDWSSILAAAGFATLGGIGLVVVWLWVAYRVVRGAIRLGSGVAP